MFGKTPLSGQLSSDKELASEGPEARQGARPEVEGELVHGSVSLEAVVNSRGLETRSSKGVCKSPYSPTRKSDSLSSYVKNLERRVEMLEEVLRRVRKLKAPLKRPSPTISTSRAQTRTF